MELNLAIDLAGNVNSIAHFVCAIFLRNTIALDFLYEIDEEFTKSQQIHFWQFFYCEPVFLTTNEKFLSKKGHIYIEFLQLCWLASFCFFFHFCPSHLIFYTKITLDSEFMQIIFRNMNHVHWIFDFCLSSP